MRFIQKGAEPPPSIAQFLTNQLPVGVNLDYENGFGRKRDLLQELIAEQFGLCAYTGTPIDDRLSARQLPPPNSSIPFRAHNEHLKPQSVCRQELRNRGLEPGRDLGEDMDHRNIVAALLVAGSAAEQFGAAARGNQALSVWPTHPNCESRFRFGRDGSVQGVDPDAEATSLVLRLDHSTLNGWRRAALDVFLDDDVIQSRANVENLIAKLDQPQDGQLTEFCFCVKNMAAGLIGVSLNP